MNKTLISSRFNKSFITYDKQAVIQFKTAQKMIFELKKQNREFATIFEIGAGTGILTGLIYNELKPEYLYVNDICENSKVVIESRFAVTKFIQGDIESAEVPGQCSLIISNAVFQWLDDLPKLFEKLSNSLTNDGIFAFSTFGVRNYNEVRYFGYGLDSYIEIAVMTEYLQPFFDVISISESIETMWFNSSGDVFKHISATGVNGISQPVSFAAMKAMIKEYEKKFSLNEKIPLTYHPQIFIVRKKKCP